MSDLGGEIRAFWRANASNKEAVQDYLAQHHDGMPVSLFARSASKHDQLKLITALDIRSTHVIILLHGIRTRAFWFDEVKPILSQMDNVIVKPIGYGYFGIFRFLFPWLTRRKPASRVAEAIKNIKWDLGSETRISVIAHSFGTYTIVSALEAETTMELYNVILCGSVVPQNYNFARIKRQIHNKLINDVGNRDIFPVLAKISSYGFGESGTFGFLSEFCEDRRHNFKHSDFFSIAFIQQFWLPLFLENTLVQSSEKPTADVLSKIIRMISILPMGILPALLVVLVPLLAFEPAKALVCDQWPSEYWCSDSAESIRQFVQMNPDNLHRVQAYLEANHPGMPVTAFLRSSNPEERRRMIKELRIR